MLTLSDGITLSIVPFFYIVGLRSPWLYCLSEACTKFCVCCTEQHLLCFRIIVILHCSNPAGSSMSSQSFRVLGPYVHSVSFLSVIRHAIWFAKCISRVVWSCLRMYLVSDSLLCSYIHGCGWIPQNNMSMFVWCIIGVHGLFTLERSLLEWCSLFRLAFL